MSGLGANVTNVLQENNTSIDKIEIPAELTVKEYVSAYFSDIPVLVEVARCESQFRQHNKRGKTLTGVVNEFDFGVMQINEMYHGKRAELLGLDLHTLEGNTAYARFLFEKEGLQPWISSAPCWKKSEAYTNYRIELALKA